jgi:DNA-binding CsgD family transcriptional regulator
MRDVSAVTQLLMAPDVKMGRATALRLFGEGDLHGARATLRPIVEDSDDPEDRLLLGRMAFVAIDFAEARDQLERAYREFQAAGLQRRAAMTAIALGQLYADGLEEPPVGHGWLNRALRLLEREEPCVEQGYAVLGLMGASVASADQLGASARQALDLAYRFGDRALECKALGDWGLALVSMGSIQDGMARLDEACTMIVGGDCTDPAVSHQVVCGMLSACDRCGDVTRARSWLRYIEDTASGGLHGAALHALAHCWSAFGSVLCQVGRFQEAEIALRMGLATGDASFRHMRFATRAALADLWIRQGRLDEAAQLVDDSVDRVEIMGPQARLYLAQHRYDLAAAVARHTLRELSGDRLRTAPLLLTVIEAELSSGNLMGAEQAAAQLAELADGPDVPAVGAQAALGLGKVAAARGEVESAANHLGTGLTQLAGDSWPLLAAALHLELARVQQEKAPASAIVAARAALNLNAGVGAPEASTAADLLRRLGLPVAAAPRPPTALDVLSARQREVLACLAEGLSNPEIAGRLFITPKTAEHHVSSILAKLGLKNRAEAAAFAASFRISPGRQASAAR